MKDEFPVKLKLRIDWSELDMVNHVNNVAYFKYIQAARVNFWEQFGLYQDFLETNIGPMLATTKCDYKRPLYYPGNILVQSRMAFIKNTSFSFQHQILNDKGELAAEAEDVMVMFDFNKNEKVPFADKYREAVKRITGNE